MTKFWKILDIAHIWKNYIDYRHSGVMGNKILIEACSMCQLRCPVCIQSTSQMELRGRNYLRFSDFKNFVDRYPQFTEIELSNYGEIFLNPELGEIIEYAFVKGIRLSALNGSNFNTVSDDMFERLVRCQFVGITVSLDGASQQTYSTYRRGGNFDTVIANIQKLNAQKKSQGIEFPKLIWQFVVFGHNEHELPAAAEMARSLGMAFFPKYNFIDPSYSPLRNPEWVRQQIERTTGKSWEQFTDAGDFHMCEQFWHSPQINWDGRLLGCCYNRWEDFGNVFVEGLKPCIQRAKYQAARKFLRGRAVDRQDIPCRHCEFYRRVNCRVYLEILRKMVE